MAIMNDGLVTALQPGDPDDGDLGRRNRGLAIAALAHIEKKLVGYKVPSQSGTGFYIVNIDNLEKPLCSCPDFGNRGAPCKHVYAVQLVSQREGSPDGSVDEGLGSTKAVKPTYPQDWRAYNAGQTHEKEHFLHLLRGLCDMVEPPTRSTIGRRPLAFSDMVFSIVLKVYYGMSARRNTGFLEDAQRLRLIDKTPHFNSVYNYTGSEEITEILEHLVMLSAVPLRGLEEHFSPDATGFGTGRYSRWYDEKYGRAMKTEKWLKAHAMTGVKTNIITAMLVTGAESNDAPHLPNLLEVTMKNFNPTHISADKGYLSRNNLMAAHEKGINISIPFKSNSVYREEKTELDVIWNKSFHFYMLHRDEFYETYHLRSNVESTFSAVKRKFGFRVSSITPVAQVNEVLIKGLCNNIYTVIMAAYKFGIDPMFGVVDVGSPHDDGPVRYDDSMPTPRIWVN